MDRYWHIARLFAVVGALVSAVIAVTTFAPGAPLLPQGVSIAVFAGVFPVAAPAIIRYKQARHRMERRGRPRIREFLASSGGRWAWAAFVLFWVVAMTGLLGGRGQAHERDGRYYLNNHGNYIEVTRQEFEHQQALSQRTFGAVPGALYVMVLHLGSYTARERRSLPRPNQ